LSTPERSERNDIRSDLDSAPIYDRVLGLLQAKYGEEWVRDEEANLRFTIEIEHVLRDVDGAHLIGEPELANGGVTLNMWVDDPIDDLMSADQLAFDIFGRISEEIFYVERQFDTKSIRYPFVTGSSRHGHVGSLVLAGPHAADFADRHQLRSSGGVRFQA
jgi:hypothetical protein